MATDGRMTRRRFLRAGTAAAIGVPLFVGSRAFGANERITLAGIGMGGRGRGDLGGALGFREIQAVAVCDVVRSHAEQAKQMVDSRYGNSDCKVYTDFREVVMRDDIDAVLIATPDHWHAIISIAAMTHGKDVYCEKPETLTVSEGREMVKVARRYGRVFSGGSQRVWGDYNWFHKMVRGGGMTDWGCHGFGGALFTIGLHETGPVEIIPPDGKDVERLTYVFANGVKIYHGGGWGGILSFRGTEGELPRRDGRPKEAPPDIYIPNYKGRDGIFGDFVHCVKTRERPFRDIEIAHRTATHCHLGNIAYWLKRPLRWDPVKEQIIGDAEASRWLHRPKREPWSLA